MNISRYSLVLACLVLMSCGEQKHAPSDHWYEPAKAQKNLKDEYVEFQMQHGASEVDAKNAWAWEEILGNTEAPRKGVEIFGDEARDLAAPQH
jgi:hypothetical protein